MSMSTSMEDDWGVGGGGRFHKMSGSGNDFVVFDLLGQGSAPPLPDSATVRRLCRRGEGIGADGVLLLTDAPGLDYRLVYYNADGSRADLCGNASLCGVRLAVELGYARADDVRFVTDAGLMRGRMEATGRPEVEMPEASDVSDDRSELWGAVGGVAAGERRLGFARVGVPHLVVLCDRVDTVPLAERAPGLRRHPSLADGANVNYVSRGAAGEWEMRTFERGVEAETLACGTGAVATATLLAAWDELEDGGPSASPGTTGAPGARPGHAVRVRIRTRSGRILGVSLQPAGGAVAPKLSGEARIVYRGELIEG